MYHCLLVLLDGRIRPPEAKLAARVDRVEACRLARIEKRLFRAPQIAEDARIDDMVRVVELREAGVRRREVGHLRNDLSEEASSLFPVPRIEAQERCLAEQPEIVGSQIAGRTMCNRNQALCRKVHVERGCDTSDDELLRLEPVGDGDVETLAP